MCLSLDRAAVGFNTAPAPNLIALFLGVWVIYLFDRVFDVSRILSTELLTKRHLWARDHITLIASLGVTVLGLLVIAVLPRVETPTLHAGIVPGLMTLAYYLIFRFMPTSSRPWQLPYKEMTVAICFALGISIAVTTDLVGRDHLILMGGLVLLFSGNCLLISRSESDLDRGNDPAAHYAGASPGRQTRWPEILLAIAMISPLPVLISGGFPLSSSVLMICSGLTLFFALSKRSDESAFTQTVADWILMIPMLVAVSKAAIYRWTQAA